MDFRFCLPLVGFKTRHRNAEIRSRQRRQRGRARHAARKRKDNEKQPEGPHSIEKSNQGTTTSGIATDTSHTQCGTTTAECATV
jgi:hypothetical protein